MSTLEVASADRPAADAGNGHPAIHPESNRGPAATLHVRVQAGGEQYAVPVEDASEVAELGVLTPVPGAPPGVSGVRNLRGTVLPVLHLATVLGLPQSAPCRRIVVVEKDGRRAGLAVEDLVGVEQLPSATEPAEGRQLRGAVLAAGALVGVIDTDSILSSVPGSTPR